MSGPTADPDPPLRGRAAAYAFGLGVLAEELERAASTWRTLTAGGGDAGCRHLADVELSRVRAAARLDTIAVEIAALPAAAGLSLLARGQLADRLRLAARNALTPDGLGLPAPPAAVASAAEEVHQVADALLGQRRDPPAAEPPAAPAASPAAAERPCRVEVTAARLTFRPPCCPTEAIVLARDVTEPLALARLDCRGCGLGYDVATLGDPDDGLWVSWRERRP